MAIEDKIQADIVQYLQSVGIYFCSIPNEGSQDKIRTMRLIGMGLRPGASDLLLILPKGRVVFMEVKSKDGTQSDAQVKFEKRVTELAHEYVLVRSIDDVKEFVETRING